MNECFGSHHNTNSLLNSLKVFCGTLFMQNCCNQIVNNTILFNCRFFRSMNHLDKCNQCENANHMTFTPVIVLDLRSFPKIFAVM